jgi:hypothetical protein
MATSQDATETVRALRERAGSFVNSHVGLWVEVEDDGTLALSADDPAELFRAALDWLTDGSEYEVVDVAWQRRATQPTRSLRLVLRSPAPTSAPASAPASEPVPPQRTQLQKPQRAEA